MLNRKLHFLFNIAPALRAFTCEGRGKPLPFDPSPAKIMLNANPKRTRLVGVRFTPDEFAKLEEMAQTAQVELSAYVRSVLIGATVPTRARGKSVDREMLGKVLVALNRIGNNINQIARQANATGDLEAYHQAKADRQILAVAAKAVVAAMEA